jgi:hypothetical protein
MKKNNLIAFSVLLLCLAACTEHEMLQYENDPAVYFFKGRYRVDAFTTKAQADSINHSFFYDKNLMEDTVWVRVEAMGYTAPVDRPIPIVQTNIGSPDAAIAGMHYKAFDSPGFRDRIVIPAGKAHVLVPVVFYRDPSLELQEVRLELEVVQNDYFRPGIDALRKFVVTTTAQAVKPSIWNSIWRNLFGSTFGTVKFRFMIETTGYLEWETVPADMSFLFYLRDTVLQKFAEYNRDNPDNPLKEANGDLVTFL